MNYHFRVEFSKLIRRKLILLAFCKVQWSCQYCKGYTNQIFFSLHYSLKVFLDSRPNYDIDYIPDAVKDDEIETWAAKTIQHSFKQYKKKTLSQESTES